MSFAGNYLQKHAFRGPLIDTPPQDDLHIVVVIPAYKEPGLCKCLGSLFLCSPPGVGVEVIALINAPENAGKETLALNEKSYELTLDWMQQHQREDIDFFVLKVDDLPKKHAGAGLARKLVMDEAVRRLDAAGNQHGIILSLDADADVEKKYLEAVVQHFADEAVSGCSIYFEHALGRESGSVGERESGGKGERESSEEVYSKEVYAAIANYELHLRYYLNAVRFTGYPYAYHTVGSSFAVRAGAYCSQGGMNKRQAGEDFYFIQKVAQLGSWSDCSTTTVHPSPRPSDRVVFGTGPDISRQLKNPGAPYRTYSFELFGMIREFFASAGLLFGEDHAMHIYKLHPLLREYLEETQYGAAIEEIRSNASTEKTFTARFFRHFNMLWILKFLHWGEDKGVEKIKVGEAGKELLSILNKPCPTDEISGILNCFREIDREIGLSI